MKLQRTSAVDGRPAGSAKRSMPDARMSLQALTVLHWSCTAASLASDSFRILRLISLRAHSSDTFGGLVKLGNAQESQAALSGRSDIESCSCLFSMPSLIFANGILAVARRSVTTRAHPLSVRPFKTVGRAGLKSKLQHANTKCSNHKACRGYDDHVKYLLQTARPPFCCSLCANGARPKHHTTQGHLSKPSQPSAATSARYQRGTCTLGTLACKW